MPFKRLVIYHANCPDGFMAAWLLWRVFDGKAEFFPANYREMPPDCKNREVYIVDFSYPRDILLKIAEESESLVVLDHHKTAEADLKDLSFCTFNMGACGARLTYDHLLFRMSVHLEPCRIIDTFIGYIEDNDLWRKVLPHTDEVRAAYLSIGWDFVKWTTLIGMGLDRWRALGVSILQYQKVLIEHHLKQVAWQTIAGVNVPVLNLTFKDIVSPLLHELSDGRPFAAAYWHNGTDFEYSLRSQEGGMDVSEIAKQYGGGGHKHAAGFRRPALCKFIQVVATPEKKT